MRIETLSELYRLEALLRMEFGEIPENIIVECDKFHEEAREVMNIPNNTPLDNLKIHDIRVMQEVVELIR